MLRLKLAQILKLEKSSSNSKYLNFSANKKKSAMQIIFKVIFHSLEMTALLPKPTMNRQTNTGEHQLYAFDVNRIKAF